MVSDSSNGSGPDDGSHSVEVKTDPRFSGRTIIVVDDEAVAREMLSDLLESRGYSVIAVSRGEDVLEVLERGDLVLLDAMLPGRDGWSICREIKTCHAPLLPVIMITARTTPEDVTRTFEAHADDYVPKPFQIAELMARIESRLSAYDIDHELEEANRKHAELAEQNRKLYEQARRDADERKRLLRELDHRVRNSLSVMMGLISIERNRHPARPTAAAFASLENRMRSQLLVYDALRGQNYRGVPLRTIIGRMAQRIRNAGGLADRVELDVKGDDALLTEQQGFSFALALNELIMNAVQHAYPGDREGTIVLSLNGDHQVHVEIQDDGIGMTMTGGQPVLGSGLSIVHTVVEQQLGGSVEYDTAGNGTSVCVSFPREELPAAQ